VVHTDNGREYVNKHLIRWCNENGIKLQTTVPHTPEQNGVAERWNRLVVELGCAMIFAHNLPSELWTDAMKHATYIRNHAFTQSIPNGTPYQKWFNKRPDILYIQEFGHEVWILNEELNPSKLEPHAIKHMFLGHEDGPHGIRYYDTTKRTIKVSCNYCFPCIETPNMTPERQFEGEQGNKNDKPPSDDQNKQNNMNKK